MPAAIPIIAAVIGAAGLGESIYSQVNAPGAPKAPTPSQASVDATALTNKKNTQTALSQEFPNIQAQTGGSLSPDAWLRLSELLSGQAGTPGVGTAGQDLIAKLFGSQGGPPEASISAGSGGTNPTGTGLTGSGYVGYAG